MSTTEGDAKHPTSAIPSDYLLNLRDRKWQWSSRRISIRRAEPIFMPGALRMRAVMIECDPVRPSDVRQAAEAVRRPADPPPASKHTLQAECRPARQAACLVADRGCSE